MSNSMAPLNLLDQLVDGHVLCIGDVMLDHFRYGSVERISPEAPIPVLRLNRKTTMLGGAGNVVRNLAAMGSKARFITVVGDDEAGREVAQLISGQGVSDAPIVDPGRRTSTKTRYISGNQQMLRADEETPHRLDDITRTAVLKAAADALSECSVMVLSDYGKGALDPETTRALIDLASRSGKPVIVDPKGSDYTPYAGATLITPNRHELSQATGLNVGSDDTVVAAALQLISTIGVEAVLATRSADGMSLVEGNAKGEPTVTHLKTEAREIFDVSGAGDTVVAALAAALSIGAPLVTAADLANTAAGIVVGKVGTAAVYADDLVQALHHRDINTAEQKVLTTGPAADVINAWRQGNHKIGFTNGCFDLLHPGHISLLTQSRAACDKLVVGLNSDTSIQRLKGEDRPVQHESARATVLASLASVDLVVIFSEDTPIDLIEAFCPDVLIKGADYTVDTVVGADVVQAYGGEIVLAELLDGHSTTNTISKISDSDD